MDVEQVQKDRNSHKKLVNLRRFSTPKNGKCPAKNKRNNNLYTSLNKATTEPDPGRVEIPHRGDDVVIGG